MCCQQNSSKVRLVDKTCDGRRGCLSDADRPSPSHCISSICCTTCPTAVQQLTRFRVTRRVARYLCASTASCSFLVQAHPGSPGQRAVKRVCVCVCVCVCLVTMPSHNAARRRSRCDGRSLLTRNYSKVRILPGRQSRPI